MEKLSVKQHVPFGACTKRTDQMNKSKTCHYGNLQLFRTCCGHQFGRKLRVQTSKLKADFTQ